MQVTNVLSTSELKFGEHLEALLTYPAQNIYLEFGGNTLSEEVSLFDLGVRRSCINLLTNISPAEFKYDVSY